MAVRTKIEPIQRDIELILKNDLSPQAKSKTLADYAKGRLADAQKTNQQALGRIPPHETFVDQRRGAPVESVKPDGTIVFEFEMFDDMLAWIGEQLVTHSPVLTGRYRDSFAFYADGLEIEPGAALAGAQEYVFMNTQPYARKIERGYSDQAPDGVFQAVASLASKRYGNIAAIKFSYRALHEGNIMAYPAVGRPASRDRRGRFSAAGRDRTAQKQERALRQPAIVIAPR